MMPMSVCPVCHSNNTLLFATGWDAEYHSTEDRFHYDMCGDCGSAFIQKPPMDRLKEIYPSNYYSFSDEASSSLLYTVKRILEIRMFRRLLSRIPGTSLAVLDVGGGIGWMLNIVRDADRRVTDTHVVDIDETARSTAEKQGHIFTCERIEDYQTSKTFDCILLINLLEHVADPAVLLNKLARILSPGGLLLIKTPNIDTLDRYIFQHHNWGGLHCPRHWVLFNEKGLRLLAWRSGLEVASYSYTQGAPQWTASILGWLADREWISITAGRPMYMHPLYNPTVALTAVFDYVRLPFSKTAQAFCLLRHKKRVE